MSLKQRIEFAANISLALCAVVLTGTFVHREYFSPPPSREELQPAEVTDWVKYAVGNERMGSTTAAVTITEFSDFECPACLRLYRTLEQARVKYRDNIAIVFRNYPLTRLHAHARAAAIAAQCAADQRAFEAYYQHLFDHQDSLRYADWTGIAQRVGVADTSAFHACLDADGSRAQLHTDSLAAAELRIPGTPLILVNSWMYQGAPSAAALEKLIESEIARSKRQ